MIEITIPGKPIAKKRPRFARIGKGVRTYNPQESEEGKIRWEAYRQLPQGWEPLGGPIKVAIEFLMPRPKSHYGTGSKINTLKGSAPRKHTLKPDIDNLQKAVYDCLNQVVWNDDAQICEAVATKTYSDRPKTKIIITEV
jgi:Holliday junction resolvase RusA-like endonuclease